MKNSYTTLHRNLDNRIHTLENETHPNQSLITDLKKQKLKLKDSINEQMDLFLNNEKERKFKQLASMIHEQKRTDKKRRKSRKKRIQHAIRRIDKASLSG